MSEILIGVMVSMVKIMSMAILNLIGKLWAYSAFVICYVAATAKLNKHWQQLKEPEYIEQTQPNTRAIDQGLRACCLWTTTCATEICSCDSKTYSRNPFSVKNPAWLLTSVACYIPANVYPIMYTTSLGDETPSTIIGGVMILWNSGSTPIAMIIFLASVVVPLAKALILSFLCFMVMR